MNRAAFALTRAQWQPLLFDAPNRADLTACIPEWPLRTVRVRVHRNHGFEAVSSAASAYAAWNGLEFDWRIGAYDDSLSFTAPGDADVEIVWLDTARVAGLGEGELGAWLAGRVRALRAITTHPIVVLAWPLSDVDRERLQGEAIPGAYVVDLAPAAASLGSRWVEPRLSSISGTRLSPQACLRVARDLACRWLPAAVLPPCKAVAVDLDGTLYRGTLGEDGVAGIELTDGHRQLQERLAQLRDHGVLLALVSRNERDDVDTLFAERTDFPLRLADFSALEVSWGDKGDALRRVADTLRIGTDAIVFVDDNPGELAAVADVLPVFTVHAAGDATTTAKALDHVAGVFRFRSSGEDRLRAADLRAARERASVEHSAASAEDYLRSLDVRLEFFVGRRAPLARCAELCAKTNQFNLALSRMNEADIARRRDERASNVVAVRLADRLSDSGIVAVVVGRRAGSALHVDELCVSCRALGRRLEDAMVSQALLLMAGTDRPDTIVFAVRRGPRNEPARRWLSAYASASGDLGDSLEMPFATIAAHPVSTAIAIDIVT